MSSTKTTQRRLSLLAGVSLVAATLSAATFTLAPSAALAQATCTSPAAPPGNGTTAVTITAGTYNPGITCNFVGTASKVSTGGAVTVSSTAGGDGVNLTATGTGAIAWDSSAGTLTAGANTNGPVIDATTTSGAINITVASVTATTAGTTHAVRATASGAGAITITRMTGAVVNNSSSNGENAFEAVSNGGNVVYNGSGGGATTGRLRGVLAQTSGSGTISVTNGGNININSSAGLATVDTIAGTGLTTITNSANTINGSSGFAIRSVSASTAATAVNVQVTGGTISGAVNFAGVTAGGVTFNATGAGRWTPSLTSTFGGGADTITLNGGAFTTVANTVINLGGGNDTFTISQTSVSGTGDLNPNTFAAGSVINFETGNDTFNLTSPRSRVTGATTLNFGDGDADVMNLGGLIALDNATLTINGVDTLNFSGVVLMGAGRTGTSNSPPVDYVNTDGFADDTLVMTGGTWNGQEGRVVFDYRLDLDQAGCGTLTGAADCLDLRGASSSGETLLTLNYFGDSALQGAYGRAITLVDMAGAGTSAQGDFVIDPDSAGYAVDPIFGGVIDRPGLFRYGMRYDPVNNRHVLTALPRSELLEYAMLSGAAQSIWHLTAETVTDRQTDLRGRAAGGVVWLRAAGEYTKRDSDIAFVSLSDTFAMDAGHKLYAGTIMGGMDLITGHSGGYDYVAGVHIGYVASSFDLNASDTSGRFSGATGGLYGGIWTERFFLDGTFNMNGLTLDYDAPGLGSETNTYTTAFGARLDGGMRWPLTEGLVVEPLATLVFSRAAFEEISLTGGEVKPADAQSRRAALGLRLAGTLGGEDASATYFVTGRAWNEFDGESRGIVANPGADLPFADELSGSFGEAEAGINLYNAANTLSGFLTSGVKFKDGYSAVNLSLGVRMAW